MNPYEQGVAHYQAAKYRRALASFTEAINQNYQPLEAVYDERSKCYEALGQIDAAKADLAHMLTLPLDEARREQITDLMALLDHANLATLPRPHKVPTGITIEQTMSGLTIHLHAALYKKVLAALVMFVLYSLTVLALWLDKSNCGFIVITLIVSYFGWQALLNRLTITLDGHNVQVTQGPLLWRAFTPLEIPYAEIAQITCQRDLTISFLGTVKAIYSLHLMSLNNSPITLLKITNCDQIRYVQWKLREQLNLPDTPQPNEYIHDKKAVGIRTKPISQLNGYDVGFFSLMIIGIASPSFCFIFVGITDPNSVQRRENFLSSERLPELLLMALHIAFTLGLITMTQILPMKRVQQLLDNGRTTHGIVTAKICKKYGGGKFYHVYYRYYGYEAVLNSKPDFDRWNVGDIIYVRYLPDKPHISML